MGRHLYEYKMHIKKVVLFFMLYFTAIYGNSQGREYNSLYPIINEYVKNFSKEFRKIPEDRRYRLNEIVYFLEEQKEKNTPWQLIFMSTNQSSVSQMTQVWSKAAAYYYGFKNFQSFSCGIKPDKISVNTIVTLEKAGFIAYKTNVDGIEVYRIKYSYNLSPIVVFPKKIGHVKNPYNNFMAVIVDENAEINISNIEGTYHRLLLEYTDPIGYENSDQEVEIYEKTCQKIAIEMFYVFAQLRKRQKYN